MDLVINFEDEEEDLMYVNYLNYGLPQNVRRFHIRVDLFNYYNDDEFVTRFRITKETCVKLFDEIKEDLTPTTMRNNAVDPITKLLTTLRFFATASFMRVLGDLAGISETSARDFVHTTSKAIAKLRPKYVNFPENMDNVKKEFFAIASFPNVLMSIDCTHIPIRCPKDSNEGEVYRNRKLFLSLNVQTAVDANRRVMDCVARWPGSTHDQRIFDNSRLRYRLESGEFGHGFAIGDGGYRNGSRFLTPLSKTGVKTLGQTRYQQSIIRTRGPVECSYGDMKRRCPILSKGMDCSVDLAMIIIQAAVVIYNLALKEPLPLAEIDLTRYEDAKVVRGKEDDGNTDAQNRVVEYFAKLK